MEYTGSCLCGRVQFRVGGPISSIIHCHCSLCRKSSGTAYATNGFVATDDFAIATGSELITSFEYKPGKYRCFCSRCGSPIYSYSDTDKKRCRIRVGLFDTEISERPIGHTFVTSRASWDDLDANLPRYEEYEPGRLVLQPTSQTNGKTVTDSTARQTFVVGVTIEDQKPCYRPTGDSLQGNFVRLDRPHSASDVSELFRATHSDQSDPGQWLYMPYGPFESELDMQSWLEVSMNSSDPFFWVVRTSKNGQPLGIASYLNIVPEHATIEIGHIWYIPEAQRTVANTETVYLLLAACFERFGYRRVEWKCDALNVRSVKAARRLGFTFEGVFRKHFIVKRRNRDTAWFAMLDSEWPERKRNFEAVLYDPNCQTSLSKLNVGPAGS